MNGHFNKRGRNQRRRQGVNPNRALDSNGPDVRIRGTAQQIYDKYLALARDATSAGDRVRAENYLQHAEHYFRVLRAIQGPQAQPVDQSGDQPGDSDNDGEQPMIGEQREAREPSSYDGDGGAGDVAGQEGSPNGAGADRSAGGRPQGGQDHENRRRRRRPRRPHDDRGHTDESGEEAVSEPADAS